MTLSFSVPIQEKSYILGAYMYKLVSNSLQPVIHDTLQPKSVAHNTRQRFDLPHFRAPTDLLNKSLFSQH